MDKRTTLTFQTDRETFAEAEVWAVENEYKLHAQGPRTRLYVRRLLGPTINVQVATDETTVTVTAWVAPTLAARIMSLFILPREIGVATGGMVAMLPRKTGRGDVNALLGRLGQPSIT